MTDVQTVQGELSYLAPESKSFAGALIAVIHDRSRTVCPLSRTAFPAGVST